MDQVRELVFFRHYFQKFFAPQTEKVKEKIDYVLFMLTHADRIPEKFLKHIGGQKVCTKYGLRLATTFSEYFAALIKENLLFYLMAFKKESKNAQTRN